MEFSNLERRAKLIGLQNMFSYCITPAILTTIILFFFFFRAQKNSKLKMITKVFLILTRSMVSQYSCICVRTLHPLDEKSNLKNKKAVLSGSKGSDWWMISAWEPVIRGVRHRAAQRVYAVSVFQSLQDSAG